MNHTITVGTLMMHTRTVDVYETARTYDELGNIRSITGKLVGKKEESIIYTVNGVRRVKNGFSLSVTDMQDRPARIRYNAETASNWTICEAIPA